LLNLRLTRNKNSPVHNPDKPELKRLFGRTAKEWREENPGSKGNLRDYATLEQLVVLSNLESYNSELIKMKILPDNRSERENP
jgi:hypothetical protein